MQDYAKLYKSRYRDAEEQNAVEIVRLIRKITRLKINPVLMLTAVVAAVEFGQTHK